MIHKFLNTLKKLILPLHGKVKKREPGQVNIPALYSNSLLTHWYQLEKANYFSFFMVKGIS
jgi:hypothetical protein